jgi:hypothetical protein
VNLCEACAHQCHDNHTLIKGGSDTKYVSFVRFVLRSGLPVDVGLEGITIVELMRASMRSWTKRNSTTFFSVRTFLRLN